MKALKCLAVGIILLAVFVDPLLNLAAHIPQLVGFLMVVQKYASEFMVAGVALFIYDSIRSEWILTLAAGLIVSMIFWSWLQTTWMWGIFEFFKGLFA